MEIEMLPPPLLDPGALPLPALVASPTSVQPQPPPAPPAPQESEGIEAEESKPEQQRTSFYVQAADDMCDAVLEGEAFLLSEDELAALKRWRGMDYQVRYLFMRLFLRKHDQWFRISALRSSYTSLTPSTSAPPLDRTPSQTPTPAPPALFHDSPSPAPGSTSTPLESPSTEKVPWPKDITDLDAACEELWRQVDFPSPEPVKAEEEGSAGEVKREEPVAGPSSPRPPPPPPSTPPPPPPKKQRDDTVLDLTLTDSDDDVLDLTHSPVRPPPKSAKARGKQPEVLLPRRSPPPPAPTKPSKPLEEDFSRIAWSAEDLAENEEPENVLATLSLDELSSLGKRMKVKVPTGRATRSDWTKALLRTSNQSTLSFFAAPPPPKEKKVGKRQNAPLMKRSTSGSIGVGYDAKGKKLTQSSVVAKQALSIIGPVIRLHPSYLLLFQRISLIYHRTSYTAVSTTSLTSSLLARFGKRRYPTYAVSRSFSIFPSRSILLRFERAVETERKVEECLDGGWATQMQLGKRKSAGQQEREGKEEKLERYRRGVGVWEGEVEREWRELVEEAEGEMKAEEDDEGKRSLYYRRRFHPGWPLARAAYKSAACYAKLGKHAHEASILRHLLSQTSFRRGKRGDWYDRLALVLMKYSGTSSTAPAPEPMLAGGGEGEVKKEEGREGKKEKEKKPVRVLGVKKEEVKSEEDEEMVLAPAPTKGKGKGTGKAGVKVKGKKGKAKAQAKAKAKKEESDEEGEGEDVKVKIDEEDDEKTVERKERLLEALQVCQQGLDDPFTHLIYKSSLLRRIARLYFALSLGPPPSHFTADLLAKPRQRTMEGERVDTPTIGRKSVWRLSDGAEGTVEELCLEQYAREGWKGFHSENGVLTMIFALTFWDIIFAPIDGVFETPYQSAPLDLSTDAFAVVRRPTITARLAEIRAGKGAELLSAVDDRERPLGTWAVGTNWDRFEKADLVEVVESMGGPALATILTVFAEEYGHRTGGIPDLCLWNPSTHRVLFAEIKGPGDTLSETQKVWLDVLLAASAASSTAGEGGEGEGGVEVEVTRVVQSCEGASESEDGEEEDGYGDEEGGGRKKKRRRKKSGGGGGGGGTGGRGRSKSTSLSVGPAGRKRGKTAEEEEEEEEEEEVVVVELDSN